MRAVVWNLEWAPRGRRERIRGRIAELAPDVLCVPEADRGILPAGGHVAEGAPDWGYGIQPSRRKALLWSRWPLDDVDPVGSPGLPPGRYVAATVRSPIGPVRLVAVCVPWSGAHVRTGRRDRAPWDEHLQYLHGLAGLVRTRDRRLPTVLLGDLSLDPSYLAARIREIARVTRDSARPPGVTLPVRRRIPPDAALSRPASTISNGSRLNQRIPRAGAPRHVHDALGNALGDLTVATAGPLTGIGGRRAIDHVAHCARLRPCAADAVDCTTRPDRLSDHDAVVVELAPA